MLLPAAAFTGWFLASEQKISFPGFTVDHLYDFSPWIVLTFIVLAVSVALFIRVRQRWFKIAELIFSGLFTSLVIILASKRLGLVSFICLAIMILSFLLVPAVVEHRLKKGNRTLST